MHLPVPDTKTFHEIAIGSTIIVAALASSAAWRSVRTVGDMFAGTHAHTPITALAEWSWLTCALLPVIGIAVIVVAYRRWPGMPALAWSAVIGGTIVSWDLYVLYMCNAVFWGAMWELA